MNELNGKAVIVTGSGRGIGAATGRLLAQMGAGVVINDIDADAAEECAAAIRAAGGQAVADPSDISDWDAAGRLVARCRQHFGTVDGLVNNAALFTMARLDELQRDSFDRSLAVNIVGTANCAAHAVKPMLAQQRGSIVNITSGAHMGINAMGVYGATKGAVASLTYSWAMELKDSGVRVNAISPMADTSMADVSVDYLTTHGHAAPPRPTVQPEANSAVIAYLLSDAAAAINGQVVRIEGEQLALIAHPAVMLPTLDRQGGWSFEAVARAFDETLAAQQVPLGIIGAKIARYAPPSRFWEQNPGLRSAS